MQHRGTPSQVTFPFGRAAIGRAVLPKLSLRRRLNRAMIGHYGTGIRNLFGSHRFHRSECRNHAQRLFSGITFQESFRLHAGV